MFIYIHSITIECTASLPSDKDDCPGSRLCYNGRCGKTCRKLANRTFEFRDVLLFLFKVHIFDLNAFFAFLVWDKNFDLCNCCDKKYDTDYERAACPRNYIVDHCKKCKERDECRKSMNNMIRKTSRSTIKIELILVSISFPFI